MKLLISDHKEITEEDLKFASLLWNFLYIKENIHKADLIFVLCSHDIRVAKYAVDLYRKQFATRILFSGGLNFFTKNIFPNSEAETFAAFAIKAGIPQEHILIENNSTNTGENIQYSKKMLHSLNVSPKSMIAIQKPSMTLRIKLALEKQWPGPQFYISSPEYGFLEAPNSYMNLFMIINEVVGDFQRIIQYPALGFQSKTSIPDDVYLAYKSLLSTGYILHLTDSK